MLPFKKPTTMEEIQENRLVWISELREGKYKQGTGKLRITRTADIPRYCCLGVACDLYDNTAWDWREHTVNQFKIDIDEEGVVNIPPEAVKFALSLDSTIVTMCVDWNDTKRHSFYQIAFLLAQSWGLVDMFTWDTDLLNGVDK